MIPYSRTNDALYNFYCKKEKRILKSVLLLAVTNCISFACKLTKYYAIFYFQIYSRNLAFRCLAFCFNILVLLFLMVIYSEGISSNDFAKKDLFISLVYLVEEVAQLWQLCRIFQELTIIASIIETVMNCNNETIITV